MIIFIWDADFHLHAVLHILASKPSMIVFAFIFMYCIALLFYWIFTLFYYYRLWLNFINGSRHSTSVKTIICEYMIQYAYYWVFMHMHNIIIILVNSNWRVAITVKVTFTIILSITFTYIIDKVLKTFNKMFSHSRSQILVVTVYHLLVQALNLLTDTEGHSTSTPEVPPAESGGKPGCSGRGPYYRHEVFQEEGQLLSHQQSPVRRLLPYWLTKHWLRSICM